MSFYGRNIRQIGYDLTMLNEIKQQCHRLEFSLSPAALLPSSTISKCELPTINISMWTSYKYLTSVDAYWKELSVAETSNYQNHRIELSLSPTSAQSSILLPVMAYCSVTGSVIIIILLDVGMLWRGVHQSYLFLLACCLRFCVFALDIFRRMIV